MHPYQPLTLLLGQLEMLVLQLPHNHQHFLQLLYSESSTTVAREIPLFPFHENLILDERANDVSIPLIVQINFQPLLQYAYGIPHFSSVNFLYAYSAILVSCAPVPVRSTIVISSFEVRIFSAREVMSPNSITG